MFKPRTIPKLVVDATIYFGTMFATTAALNAVMDPADDDDNTIIEVGSISTAVFTALMTTPHTDRLIDKIADRRLEKKIEKAAAESALVN